MGLLMFITYLKNIVVCVAWQGALIETEKPWPSLASVTDAYSLKFSSEISKVRCSFSWHDKPRLKGKTNGCPKQSAFENLNEVAGIY